MAPYFHQTWAFPTLSGLGLILAAYGIHRRRLAVQRKIHRLEQQNAVEQERARIAHDMHDEIGTQLCQMAVKCGDYTTLTSNQVNPEKSVPSELIHLIHSAERSLDEVVWAVRPEKDNLASLCDYLGQFAQEFLESTEIALRLRFPDPLPEWPLARIFHTRT